MASGDLGSTESSRPGARGECVCVFVCVREREIITTSRMCIRDWFWLYTLRWCVCAGAAGGLLILIHSWVYMLRSEAISGRFVFMYVRLCARMNVPVYQCAFKSMHGRARACTGMHVCVYSCMCKCVIWEWIGVRGPLTSALTQTADRRETERGERWHVCACVHVCVYVWRRADGLRISGGKGQWGWGFSSEGEGDWVH